MKKHSLFKVLGITFLIFVVLSWIIPTGSYSSGTFTKAAVTPLGIFDILLYPAATLSYQAFAMSGIVILFIGGLYGILNKIGVFSKAVQSTVKKVGENKKLFLAMVMFGFILLSSLTNQTLTLFIAVPFFIAVILSLGFNRISAFFATFGAILVGQISSLTNHSVEAYQTQGLNFMEYFFDVKISSTIGYTAILFAAITIAYMVFVLLTSKIEKKPVKKTAKKETKTTKTSKTTKATKNTAAEKKEEVVIPLYNGKEKENKNATAAVVLTSILFVLVIFTSFSWSSIGVNVFNDIHTSITNVKIGNYAIVSNIMGSISAIGYWSQYEVIAAILILIVIIKLVYKISWKEGCEAFVDGVKEMLPVALIVVCTNILLYTTSSLATTTIFATIANAILGLSKSFNLFLVSATSFIGSPVYSTFPYLLNAIYDPMTSLYSSNLPMIAIITQSMYGLAMMVFPTSAVLMMGLQYLDISYKEWFKNAWKILLLLLVLVLLVLVIINAII